MPDSAARLNQDRGVSYLYIAAALVIVVAGMRAAEAIVNPLLLAVFLPEVMGAHVVIDPERPGEYRPAPASRQRTAGM